MFGNFRKFSKIASVASITYVTHHLTICEPKIPATKSDDIVLLSGTGNPTLSKAISEKLGIPLTKLKLERFSGKISMP